MNPVQFKAEEDAENRAIRALALIVGTAIALIAGVVVSAALSMH